MPWVQVKSRQELWNFLCGGDRTPCSSSCGNDCQHGEYIVGHKFLVLKSAHGKFLTAGLNTQTDHIENNHTWVNNNGKFDVLFLKNAEVALRTSSGTYWSAQPSGNLIANCKSVKEHEKFTLYMNDEDETKLAIKTFNNRWISAQPNGKVEANRTMLDKWETFTGWQPVPPGWYPVCEKFELGNFLGEDSQANCDKSSPRDTEHSCLIPSSYLTLKSYHGHYVTSGCTDSIKNNSDRVGDNEKFELELLPFHMITLKTASGRHWFAGANGELRAEEPFSLIPSHTQFRVFLKDDHTKLALQTHCGKWVCAERNGDINANRNKLKDWETFTSWKAEKLHNALLAMIPPKSMVPGLAEKYVKKFPKGSPEFHWFKSALQYLERKHEVNPGTVERYKKAAINAAKTKDGFIEDWGSVLGETGRNGTYANFLQTIRHRLSNFVWEKEDLKMFRKFTEAASKISKVRGLDTGHNKVKEMWSNHVNEMRQTLSEAEAEEQVNDTGELAKEVAADAEVSERLENRGLFQNITAGLKKVLKVALPKISKVREQATSRRTMKEIWKNHANNLPETVYEAEQMEEVTEAEQMEEVTEAEQMEEVTEAEKIDEEVAVVAEIVQGLELVEEIC